MKAQLIRAAMALSALVALAMVTGAARKFH